MRYRLAPLLLLVGLFTGCLGGKSVLADDVKVDWPRYIAQHDMHWKALPRTWEESPFIGNGMMGSMLFLKDDNSLTIQLGRSDVQDHRLEAGIAPNTSLLPNQSRLPIGHFTLDTVGNITGCDLRLDLWNAQITGNLFTQHGVIEIVVFMHSQHDLLVVHAKASQGEDEFQIAWHPEEAFCPRVRSRREAGRKYHEDYVPNPPPKLFEQQAGADNIPLQFCVQPLLAGGQTATAYLVSEGGREKPREKTLLASVAHTYPERGAQGIAAEVVRKAEERSLQELQKTHRAWWHAFYPRSFISLPDQKLESFFWAQHYKMASACRRPEVLADNQGPWLQPTSWPALWWNLNVQLAYSHMLPANHPELSIGLIERMVANEAMLMRNAPAGMRHDSIALTTISGQDFYSPVKSPAEKPGTCLGNATWVMHNCYQQYRYTMERSLLREKIYPLLTKAINLYRHVLFEGDDGKLHLPKTSSPEYPRGNAEDCNYDLALLRWGCQALVDSAATLGIDDPLLPEWKDILARLVDYPANENGWMIGKDFPFATGHRHYSHLLMFYPLATIDLGDPATRDLARKSLIHWQSFPKGKAGYSYTGSSSMFAHLGEGNRAEQRMQDFLSDKILVNTFYKEGVSNPVIETPPAGARAIEDMLIQSWGDTVRVFPAVPEKWSEIAFADLRAEGAFLVSASRQAGKTQMVAIKSLAGAHCRLQTSLLGPIKISGQPDSVIRQLGEGVVEFQLPAGESVVLSTTSYAGGAEIKPVTKSLHADWRWGKLRND